MLVGLGCTACKEARAGVSAAVAFCTVSPASCRKQCDANLDIFLTAVRSVANVSPDGFAAVKVTALGDPALLERVSVAVKSIHGFFFDLWKEEQSRAGDERTSTVSRESFIKQWVAVCDRLQPSSLALQAV